jgi:hypothetical protein
VKWEPATEQQGEQGASAQRPHESAEATAHQSPEPPATRRPTGVQASWSITRGRRKRRHTVPSLSGCLPDAGQARGTLETGIKVAQELRVNQPQLAEAP